MTNNTTKMCCANCFGDRTLEKEIAPILSMDTGNCSYCNSKSVPLIRPIDLQNYFVQIINIYEFDDSGISIVRWLKEDWNLFSHPYMDTARASLLLADILNDGEIVKEHFAPRDSGAPDTRRLWEDLSKELMCENRYFPENSIWEDDRGNHLKISEIISARMGI